MSEDARSIHDRRYAEAAEDMKQAHKQPRFRDVLDVLGQIDDAHSEIRYLREQNESQGQQIAELQETVMLMQKKLHPILEPDE